MSTGISRHAAARQPGLVAGPGQLERDVRARLAGAHHEHRAGQQLLGLR